MAARNSLVEVRSRVPSLFSLVPLAGQAPSSRQIELLRGGNGALAAELERDPDWQAWRSFISRLQ